MPYMKEVIDKLIAFEDNCHPLMLVGGTPRRSHRGWNLIITHDFRRNEELFAMDY